MRAVVVAAAMLLACHERREVRASTPVERLVAAVPRSGRRVEARFSGDFPCAPVRAVPATEEADLESVAGAILKESDRRGALDSLHAAGVGRALLGSFDDSVNRLERVCVQSPKDATAWNDLAAARYALAVDRHEPQRLPAALSAVDRALRLAPLLPQARFNRALILTRLGMRNAATRAWRDASAAERDGAWAKEVAGRASTLRRAAAPPVDLDGALKASDAGDQMPLRAAVAARPEKIRLIAETTMLAAWAEAQHGGRQAQAAPALARAGRVGDLLAGVNGDWLVSDVVRSIASASATGRQRLATSFLAYRDARMDYAKRRRHGAEELRDVAARFACAGSPMEHVARYYGANALLEDNRLEESRVALERVLEAIDAARYPSLAAGAEKELGLYYGFRGMWTTSLTHLERACAGFAAHREPINAAFAEATTGEAYDLIGDFERGWQHRTAALDVLTRSSPDYRSLSVVIGAVHAEIMRGDYESALSLLRVARQEAANVSIPDVTVEMILSEARVLLIARGVAEAQASLAEAKRVAGTIQDEGIRKRLDAEAALVEAATVRRSHPERAVAVVTPAISFFRSHGFGILLPPAYLERGRAEVASGARDAAKKDFDAGLRWIEQQRANVRVDIRTTLFDTVPELTGQLVDLLLGEGDTRGAYAVVERARARTLVEALGVPKIPRGAGADTIAATLPPNAMVIEYALLPDGVAAFCIGRKGMTVHRLAVKPAQLRRAIPELRARIQDRTPIAGVQEIAAQLYTDLFQPLEPAIGNATVLYVVPDRFLHATPFPALYDARTKLYLIQKHRLILAPSGAFLLRRSPGERPIRPALIIADPTSPAGGKRLDAARREALATAELFDAPPPLVGRDATIARFVGAAPQSALIHYAGHAHSDDTAGGFLPLAPTADSDGRLDATAISRLPLQRTGLVILSACATMRGDVSRVEGMPSLSRAFLNAGAKAVVGMLWEVDDETTAALLAPFHRRVRDGMSPSQALQEAQLEMLHSDRADLRHPAAWSAAAFLGND